mgnify:FL=1
MNNEKELQEYFKKLAKDINVEINDEEINEFSLYMDLLLEWNEKINLTAITEKNEIILKHFIDSLTIYKYIKENDKIADVGTGAGFPGIPLAIMKNKNEVILVDSLNKRINFLNEVIQKIELENVIAIHSRAEDLGKDKKYREKFDIVTSRAVANLTVLVEYLLPLVDVGGYCICMKGPNIEEELNQSKFAIRTLGGKIEKVEKIILPDSDFERNIVIIKKEQYTDKRYPRKAGMPLKNPLLK